MSSTPVVIPDVALLLAFVVGIGLVPMLALMVTSYAKIVIVLGLLRQAIGLQQTPPNMVLNGVAMILSFFIMAPVFVQGYENLMAKRPAAEQAFGSRFADLKPMTESFVGPLKEFLDAHVDERNRAMFMRGARQAWPAGQAETLGKKDLVILVPSFMLTELTEAFQIGFLLYLVFVVIDIVVANILLALGMSMMSPTMISVPFKLLLFVSISGWSRLVESLILGYRVGS